MQDRGAREEEVMATLSKGKELMAPGGRKAREMVFSFDAQWQGKFYHQKKLRVVYIEQGNDLVAITVYTYFGKWERANENLLRR